MGFAEARLTVLEGRVEEQVKMVDSLRGDITRLEERMDRRFDAVDQRFAQVDQRFADVDRRFDRLEQKMDTRFDAMDAKMSRQFMWLAGMMVTTLAAMLAAVLSR